MTLLSVANIWRTRRGSDGRCELGFRAVTVDGVMRQKYHDKNIEVFNVPVDQWRTKSKLAHCQRCGRTPKLRGYLRETFQILGSDRKAEFCF